VTFWVLEGELVLPFLSVDVAMIVFWPSVRVTVRVKKPVASARVSSSRLPTVILTVEADSVFPSTFISESFVNWGKGRIIGGAGGVVSV